MQLLWSVTLITSLGDSEEITSTLGTNAQDRLILLHQDWWIGPKQKQIPPPATCFDDVTHEVDVQLAINDRRKGSVERIEIERDCNSTSLLFRYNTYQLCFA